MSRKSERKPALSTACAFLVVVLLSGSWSCDAFSRLPAATRPARAGNSAGKHDVSVPPFAPPMATVKRDHERGPFERRRAKTSRAAVDRSLRGYGNAPRSAAVAVDEDRAKISGRTRGRIALAQPRGATTGGRYRGSTAAAVRVAGILAAAVLTAPVRLEMTDVGSSDPSQLWRAPPRVSVVRSIASALTEEQLLVDDVWREVTRQYVDKTYNGLGEEGWSKKRSDAVKSVAGVGPDDSEVVYAAIRTMLGSLNDPYTRFLTPDQYSALTTLATGADTAGVGISLSIDPSSGDVVVASTVPEGPADRAGISPGDAIIGVDDIDATGATPEAVAARCRGEVGTSLSLAVRRIGVEKTAQLSLTRARIKVNPVVASDFENEAGERVGVLKISSFSKETPAQVTDGLRVAIDGGATAVVMDLRGNMGGYMPAGVDIANLFLSPKARIISEVDRNGRATIYVSDGIGSETRVPLYLLVDGRTASASEIFVGALQDNGRATVVSGGGHTFGKGLIQNVQSLEGGGGVAVTRAKYVTPGGRSIQGVGITPDKVSRTCKKDDSAAICLFGLV